MIVLTRPPSSAASDTTLIDEAGADLVQAPVVQYECTPPETVASDIARSGRVNAPAIDRLRVGVTAMTENTESGDDQRI